MKIRSVCRVLDHPADVTLLSVSYPPGEAALVWEISSGGDFAETVRISYLLSNIDRLITYKAVANKPETLVDLKSYLVLRNFSGEDFAKARVLLDYGEAFEQGIDHEETKQMLFLTEPNVPVRKIWTFDAAHAAVGPGAAREPERRHPRQLRGHQQRQEPAWASSPSGAARPASSRRTATAARSSSARTTPRSCRSARRWSSTSATAGISSSRSERCGTPRSISARTTPTQVVLFDTDEIITAKIENFKDSPAVLTMIQHIPGQWDMEECNMKYTKKDATTLKFEIELPAANRRGPGGEGTDDALPPPQRPSVRF